MTMTELIDEPPRQLAYRANGGIEVTLLWHPATDQLRVCVCDERHGGYFEVLPEPHQGPRLVLSPVRMGLPPAALQPHDRVLCT
jgi:hypothetical protein